jgi:hypothetical protein
MIKGMENATVFPDPVKAMPIISLPLNATGRPCTWMGVGLLIFFSLNADNRSLGNPMPSNVLIGGGT